MDIKDLMRLQQEFDEQHVSVLPSSEPVTEENADIPKFLIISLFGEVGELANIIKKVLRGDFSLNASRRDIAEECADIFGYLMKFCNQMNISLEQSFLEKLEKNRHRFERYRKETSKSRSRENQDAPMVTDLFDSLYKVKHASEDEIKSMLNEMCSKLSTNRQIVKGIRDALDSEYVKCELGTEDLIFAVLGSFVVGDIGYEMSPYLRADNLEKMRAIFQQREIDLRFVTRLTALERQIQRIICDGIQRGADIGSMRGEDESISELSNE